MTDDITPFDNDALPTDNLVVQALLAPAQEHELAGEAAAVAMFRQSLPARRRRRRAITRATVGGAGIILGLGLTSGVAAAYTTGLPDPVQDVVHSAIDPLPVPAPPTAHALHLKHVAAARARARQRARAAARAAAGETAPGSHSASPVPRHSAGGAQPGRTPGTAVAPPAQSSPAPQRSASPTPAPRPTLTVAVSRTRVPVHQQVVLSGRLTRGDAALPGRTVYAAELPAGESSWRRVASGQTASDGTISLTIPALTTNARLRLVTGQGVTSRQVAVVVVPKLTLSQARSGNDRVVTVTADGGRPGDAVNLFRRDGTTWTLLTSTTLAGDDTTQFTVPGPSDTRVAYQVRLPATGVHGASFVEFVVPARSA